MVNPSIWSLWDIMNIFDVCALSHVIHKITQVQMALEIPRLGGIGNKPVDDSLKVRMEKALDDAEHFFTIVEMPDCVQAVALAKEQWKRPLRDISSACEIAYRLQIDIIKSLENRQFLRVSSDRLDLLLHMRGEIPHGGVLELFGDSVSAAFIQPYLTLRRLAIVSLPSAIPLLFFI